MTYDWSRVSRETLERLAQSIHTSHAADVASDAHLQERLGDARTEAIVPPLRTRAEVDAEIAQKVRNCYMPTTGVHVYPEHLENLGELVAEPLAPDPGPIIDCEFPEAAPGPDECERGGDCIESITRPGFCAKCEREMPRRVHGAADPEACSCEESERLKARVRELESAVSGTMDQLRLQERCTVKAVDRAASLRERLETLCKGCGIPGAEPGILTTFSVLEALRA